MANTQGKNLCAMHLWRKIRGGGNFRNRRVIRGILRQLQHRIIYIDERSGGPHIFDRQFRRYLRTLGHRRLTPNEVAALVQMGVDTMLIRNGTDEIHSVLSGLIGYGVDITDAKPAKPILSREEIIQIGLTHGLFRDTDGIRRWIDNENRKLGPHRYGMHQLELVVFNAHTEIDDLYELIMLHGLRPPAVIASGSGEMLDQVKDEPWLKKTLKIIGWARDNNVPFLGICFGMQALGYQMTGLMPMYHQVPKSVTHERHPLGVDLPVVPDARRMIYGSRVITPNRFISTLHPVMTDVREISALEAHSMGFELGPHSNSIPLGLVQAISADRFYNETLPTQEVTRLIIEVIAERSTVGVQPHPELDPLLLFSLLELPAFAEFMRHEGQDLKILRYDLHGYSPEKKLAGARFGYNFCKFVVTPNWVQHLQDIGKITADTAREMLDKRMATNRRASTP